MSIAISKMVMLKKRAALAGTIAFSPFFIGMHTSFAQHPIEVQRYQAQGEYMQALVAFERLPERRTTTDTRISAGKSAWALGIPTLATAQIDIALRDPDLDTRTRADLVLSRGIIEFQEGHFAESVLYAEKAISLLKKSSPLRARAYLLWGQGLARMKAYGAAHEKYENAMAEASDDDLPEMSYQDGTVLLRLGQFDKARAAFERIPLEHERAPATVRRLALIALELENWESARFWLQKGRAEFSELFIDSWVDYALVTVQLALDETAEARRTLARAKEQFAPSDPWIVLADSTYESSYWSTRARLKEGLQ